MTMDMVSASYLDTSWSWLCIACKYRSHGVLCPVRRRRRRRRSEHSLGTKPALAAILITPATLEPQTHCLDCSKALRGGSLHQAALKPWSAAYTAFAFSCTLSRWQQVTLRLHSGPARAPAPAGSSGESGSLPVAAARRRPLHTSTSMIRQSLIHQSNNAAFWLTRQLLYS